MYDIKPTIKRPNGKTKAGRGFSPDELAQAGITYAQANQLGIPVDFRRKSAHENNIEVLKAHVAANKPEA
ncbi:MAG: ribosomal protein L13e [Nitrososphaerota archaeon]|jgi:large subunit ribosomal protein L13e|nr:ribosomal protein L13e [Nitrososphaerota archaeon]